MRISQIIWLEDIVTKLLWKHDVNEFEVVEVLENKPVFVLKEARHRTGEDVYAVFGETNGGRLLSIFFVYTLDERAIIVSARDMNLNEKKKYVR